MITASIFIGEQAVSTGVFLVLPRVGEHVRVQVIKEGTLARTVTGQVDKIVHVSFVRIRDERMSPEAEVVIYLRGAKVE